MSCSFASASIYRLPAIGLLQPQPAVVNLAGLVHISEYNPDCQNCPELDKLEFDFHVDCSGLVDVQGDGVNDTFDRTYVVEDPHLGINKVATSFQVELFDGAAFNPQKQPEFKSGACTVSATATLFLVGGGTISSVCADGKVCFVPIEDGAPPNSPPIVEIFALDGDTADLGTGNSIGYPGDPQYIRYKIKNNSSKSSFMPILEVTSDNVNVKAVYAGPDPAVATFNVSTGDGDDFPVAYADGTNNECVTLPASPGDSIDQSAQGSLSEIMPGGELIIEIRSRTWGNCGDGSCSKAVIDITGDVGAGMAVHLCVVANFMASSTTDNTGSGCTGGPLTPPEVPPCNDSGYQNEADQCFEDVDCDYEIPISGRLRWPASRHPKDVPSDELPPPIDHHPIAEGFQGAVFKMKTEGDKLFVVKYGDTTSSASLANSTVSDSPIDHHRTRVTETLELSSATTIGDTIDLKIGFAVVQKIDGVKSKPMLTVGSKSTPGSEAYNTFIALSDVWIDTTPRTRSELMSQVAAWMIEPATKQLFRAKLTPTNFTATAVGIELEFQLEAPLVGSEIQLSYDFRSFSRSGYEQECDDMTDNDMDGDIDCADSDCADHPACDDRTSGAGGAGATAVGAGGSTGPGAAASDDASGCSCGVVGSDSGERGSAAFGLFLLAAAAASRKKWRRSGRGRRA
jgi:hypothetical protein